MVIVKELIFEMRLRNHSTLHIQHSTFSFLPREKIFPAESVFFMINFTLAKLQLSIHTCNS